MRRLVLLAFLVGCSSSRSSEMATADATSAEASSDARAETAVDSPGSDTAAPIDGASDGASDVVRIDSASDAATDGAGAPIGTSSTLGGTTTGSSACGGAAAPTGVQTLSLSVDGATRTGLFVVPTGYDPTHAYPIVFVFHGDGGTGADIRASLNLETAAAGKAIFAYPDGADQTWDATLGGGNADMDFVMAIRSALRAQYCIDDKRTFGTGMSRGAFFVNQLACQYGIAEFAAMAPHSGTIDPGNDAAYVYGPPNAVGGPYMEDGNYDFMCPVDGVPSSSPPLPMLPPPMMIIHGQCDTEEGVEFAEGRRTAEHWGFAARCSSTPAVSTDANQACSPGTSCPVTSPDPCYQAPGCASGHDITFCAIPGMGHDVWCDAPARIWAFFAAH